MINLIGNFIVVLLFTLSLLQGSAQSAPNSGPSPYTARISPAEISIQPGDILPMTFETDIAPVMDGALYHAEFGYSPGLEISDIRTEPLASRIAINTRKNKVVFEWEEIAFKEGSKLNARFSVSALKENIYTIAPLKLYFKANGKGKAINITGNTSSITVASITVPPPPPPPPGSYSLETIRPTDAYNPDAWTDMSAAFDNSIITYSYKDTPNSTPSISFGANALDESINAWEHKLNYWNSAWLSIDFQKGPAADDEVNIAVTDSNGGMKHSIIAADGMGVARNEYIKRLNISDWGEGFANIDDLRVRISGKKQKGSDTAESRVYDVKIMGDNAPFVKDFTMGAGTSLPLSDINLPTDYGPEQISKAAEDDSVRVSQWTDSESYPIHMFKLKTASDISKIKWNGQVAQSIAEAFAQSFLPTTSGRINNVNIYFQKTGTPRGNLKVRIRSDLNGDVISESHPVSETGLDINGSWKTFSFNTPAEVVKGSTYYMEIWRDNYDAINYPEIKVMNCETNNTKVWRRNAGNWTTDENNIFLSTIYIDGTAETNPQSCTYPDQYEKSFYGIEQKNIYLEIFNKNTSYWDLLDILKYDGSKTDINLSGFALSSDYYGADNWISARVYAESGSDPFLLATDSMQINTIADTQEISLDSSTLNFGSIDVNSSSLKNLILSNSGGGELTISTITGISSPFSIAIDKCSGQILTASESCTIQISFNPLSEGSFSSSLTIPSNDSDNPAATANLNGSSVSSVLTGTITDALTALPLQNVSILVSDSLHRSYMTNTDLYGKYYISGIAPGAISAEFKKGDYYTETANKELFSETDNVIDTSLNPVVFNITSPADGSILDTNSISVSGTVKKNYNVTVNNITATVIDNTFSASIPVNSGTNTITAKAVDASGYTYYATTTIHIISPLIVTVTSHNNGEITSSNPVTINGDIYSTAGTGGSKESLGQSFKAGRNGKLTQISLPLYRSGTSAIDKLHVRLSSVIGGETIAVSRKIDFNSIPSPSYDWVDFSFDSSSQVDLINGETYYIELWRESKDNNNVASWLFGSIDYYPGGERFIRDSHKWSYPLEWGDFAFKVYIDGTIDQQQLYLGLSNYLDLYGLSPYPLNITVNGTETTIDNNSYSASISLNEGPNTISIEVSDNYNHTASENIDLILQSEISGTVSGIVTDLSTGLPIEGAEISITDSSNKTQLTLTSGDGLYTINGIAEGLFSGKITKDGYTYYEFSDTISANQNIIINTALDPELSVISNIQVISITADSAAITWETDQPADSFIGHGTSIEYGNTIHNPALTTVHSIAISDILPSTTYHFMVSSTNIHGFTSTSSDRSFTTKGMISISINSPSASDLISRPDIMVQGTIENTTGNETGIKVNGISAIIYNDMFFANNIPLVDGQNSIIASATDTAGNTASTSMLFNAVTNAPHISLRATIESGTVPLTTYFSLSSNIPEPIASYTLDNEGDNTIDDTGRTFEDTKIIYSTEGIYYPTMTVTDNKGNSYTDTIAIIVPKQTEIDTLLRSKWNSIKTALAVQNIPKAIENFSNNSKVHYSDIFNALYDTLPELIQNMQDIQLIYIKNNVAKYRITKNEIYGEQNTALRYYIYFIVDNDGIWKIERF